MGNELSPNSYTSSGDLLADYDAIKAMHPNRFVIMAVGKKYVSFRNDAVEIARKLNRMHDSYRLEAAIVVMRFCELVILTAGSNEYILASLASERSEDQS